MFSVTAWNLSAAGAALRLLCCPAQARDVAAAPKFDAASIKVSVSAANTSSVMEDQSGNLAAENATLQMLINNAYRVRADLVLGGPAWMRTDRFNILAKPAHKAASGAEFREMEQELLASRFSLRIHHETRELPIYVLSVAKSGARLPEWKNTVGPSCQYTAGELTCHKVATADLARELSRRIGREVLDRASLTGPYDLTLRWTPDEFQVAGPAEMGKAEQSADLAGPSLFGALQEQLGLTLAAAKGPVDVLVIDHAEKPSGN